MYRSSHKKNSTLSKIKNKEKWAPKKVKLV